MRSMALKAALAAILVSAPLSMAFAGGDRDRGHDHGGGGHGHGHHERGPDHVAGRPDKNRLAIAGSKGYTDGDNTNSSALAYGQKPPVCSPYTTTWTCIPPHGYR